MREKGEGVGVGVGARGREQESKHRGDRGGESVNERKLGEESWRESKQER